MDNSLNFEVTFIKRSRYYLITSGLEVVLIVLQC